VQGPRPPWFPRPHDLFAITVAKQVCQTCRVRADFLSEALAAPFDVSGIWGGLTAYERHQLASRAARQVS
jgi:hypothetical protein